MMEYQFNTEFALNADRNDAISSFRNEFYFPMHNGRDVIYFTGNSLGLQPKSTEKYIGQELEDWKLLGVEGHMHARRPWMPYHEFLTPLMAEIVGAKK